MQFNNLYSLRLNLTVTSLVMVFGLLQLSAVQAKGTEMYVCTGADGVRTYQNSDGGSGCVSLNLNPITIVPLYLIAVAYGDFLLGGIGQANIQPAPHWNWSAWLDSSRAFLDWMFSMGPSLAVGLPALMVTLSILGYISVRVAWNIGVRFAVVQRRKRSFPTTR